MVELQEHKDQEKQGLLDKEEMEILFKLEAAEAGGWFGGGGAPWGGAGGGSGWVFTEENVNSGFTSSGNIGGTWLLANTHLLEDAYTIAGDMGVPAFDGIESGNGRVNITLISVDPTSVTKELSLIGSETITMGLGSTFTDPGVVLTRNGEEILPVGTITVIGTVNTSISGSYTITYSYTSAETGGTYTVSRTVDVVNQIENFAFTGNIQSTTLQPGTYLLEVWGASGGSIRGGAGGFTEGIFTIENETEVFVVVGGQGSRSNNFGYGGGGATHMSLATGHLTDTTVRNNILLVAGRRRRKQKSISQCDNRWLRRWTCWWCRRNTRQWRSRFWRNSDCRWRCKPKS